VERLVKGDIIIIDFPYSNLVHYKRRPAIVIKIPKGEDIIVCQITGSSSEESTELVLKESDFQQGSLKRQSYIRVDKIFSVEKLMINYKVGSLRQEKFNEILEKICLYLKS